MRAIITIALIAAAFLQLGAATLGDIRLIDAPAGMPAPPRALEAPILFGMLVLALSFLTPAVWRAPRMPAFGALLIAGAATGAANLLWFGGGAIGALASFLFLSLALILASAPGSMRRDARRWLALAPMGLVAGLTTGSAAAAAAALLSEYGSSLVAGALAARLAAGALAATGAAAILIASRGNPAFALGAACSLGALAAGYPAAGASLALAAAPGLAAAGLGAVALRALVTSLRQTGPLPAPSPLGVRPAA